MGCTLEHRSSVQWPHSDKNSLKVVTAYNKKKKKKVVRWWWTRLLARRIFNTHT